MSFTPLPAFKDLVPIAERFEIFQKSLGSSFSVSSVAFIATKGPFSPSRGGSNSKSRRSHGGYNGGHGHGRGKRAPIPLKSNRKTKGHMLISDWFTDTGVSIHLIPDPSQSDKVEPYHGKDCVIVGNRASFPITHIGTKLTSDFPLSVLFSHDNFVVQNRVIGLAVAIGK
ncbi:hypothetical protein AAG906_015479 [Vitis piasezkii]